MFGRNLTILAGVLLATAILTVEMAAWPDRSRLVSHDKGTEPMAVDTHFWVGSGLFSTSGNWTPAGPPGAGDTAILDGRSQNNMTGSDESATALAAFIVRDGNRAQVGSDGTPLIIEADKFSIRGRGAAYLQPSGTTDPKILVDTYIGGNKTSLKLTGRNPEILDVLGGLVVNSSTSGSMSQHVTVGASRRWGFRGGRLEWNALYSPYRISLQEGELAIYSAISVGVAVVDGGELIMLDGNATFVYVAGGVVNWQSDGTLTRLSGISGTFDSLQGGPDPKDITIAYIMPGCEVLWSEATKAAITTLRDLREEEP
ncbi:MAG: hypothetical protein JSU86_04455 [Phycisphaerales bacterium]|nr:MAG: hypothetical protein JSU86_04455 [Phycisphaerales bacterium]